MAGRLAVWGACWIGVLFALPNNAEWPPRRSTNTYVFLAKTKVPAAAVDLFWFRCLSRMIPHVADSSLPGTICAAIESTSCFDAVTDNFAAAMGAARSERVNRTFKTVEYMRTAAHPHFEGLIILVSAHFTLSHFRPPPPIVHGSLVENGGASF